MEYYQRIQNRAGQTVAVLNEYMPAMTVGGFNANDLETRSESLDGLAQGRSDALTAYDGANNAEHMAFGAIRRMDLSLPKAAEGELNEVSEAEKGLLDLYDGVYAVQPRTTESAIDRGHTLVSALNATNTYLAAQVPPRGPISSGGKLVADLVAALAAQPPLEQTLEDRSTDLKKARNDLRSGARGVDRLSKRFYKALLGEAQTNTNLAAALDQIDTGPDEPETLGIFKVLQGGDDELHILVSYENGTFTPGATNTVEWMIDGVDQDFSHTGVDPSGNALGPFATGQTIKLRTRVHTGSGTTTGAVRTLTLLAPGS